MIENSKFDIAEVWNVAKRTKLRYLAGDYSTCESNIWIPDQDVSYQVDRILETLGVVSDEKVYDNISHSGLENARRLFLYISFCNSKMLDLVQYFQLFENLIMNKENGNDLSIISQKIVNEASKRVHDKNYEGNRYKIRCCHYHTSFHHEYD